MSGRFFGSAFLLAKNSPTLVCSLQQISVWQDVLSMCNGYLPSTLNRTPTGTGKQDIREKEVHRSHTSSKLRVRYCSHRDKPACVYWLESIFFKIG